MRRMRGLRPICCAAALAVLSAGCGEGGGATAEAAPAETTVPPTTAIGDAEDPTVSAGCMDRPADRRATVEAEHLIEVGGEQRRYLLTTPASDGDEPLPVVFDFHGLMEGSEVHARMSEYSALAEEEGFIAVFPEGSGDPLHWNVAASGPNEDLDYFDALLGELVDDTCVDLSRIYATGLSNGAMFTSLLMCQRSRVLAAAVPVAGLLDLEPCSSAHPVPTLTYHGTADPILLFNGGVDTSAIPGLDDGGDVSVTTDGADLFGEGYPAAAAAVAERNGCDPEPTDEPFSDEVIRRVYDCPAGADVEFWIIEGGGHSWPSSQFSVAIEGVVGPTTFDVDATRDGWDFMSRHANTAG